jgi:hypothetical protein
MGIEHVVLEVFVESFFRNFLPCKQLALLHVLTSRLKLIDSPPPRVALATESRPAERAVNPDLAPRANSVSCSSLGSRVKAFAGSVAHVAGYAAAGAAAGGLVLGGVGNVLGTAILSGAINEAVANLGTPATLGDGNMATAAMAAVMPQIRQAAAAGCAIVSAPISTFVAMIRMETAPREEQEKIVLSVPLSVALSAAFGVAAAEAGVKILSEGAGNWVEKTSRVATGTFESSAAVGAAGGVIVGAVSGAAVLMNAVLRR